MQPAEMGKGECPTGDTIRVKGNIREDRAPGGVIVHVDPAAELRKKKGLHRKTGQEIILIGVYRTDAQKEKDATM